MEFTRDQIKITKGVAILFMMLLHLFCTKNYEGLYTPLIFIGNTPLMYYLALFGDCCVAIYCFCSGYGLILGYKKDEKSYFKKNILRILKLYINFWIILVIFVLILGPILGKADVFPGSLKTFILTFTAISTSYNGAWWFITTYIILVLISPWINKMVIKKNNILIVFISFILYFMGYLQRIKGLVSFDNEILNWFFVQMGFIGTSQFPFVIGVIFADKKIYSKLYNFTLKIKFKNLIGLSLILALIVAHGFVETLFIAVFTGIAFICIFNLIDKPKWLNEILRFLSNHSTNMWLVHMFIYSAYFREIVYAPKYSILIFLWLVVICIAISYVISYINKIISILFKDNNKDTISIN